MWPNVSQGLKVERRPPYQPRMWELAYFVESQSLSASVLLKQGHTRQELSRNSILEMLLPMGCPSNILVMLLPVGFIHGIKIDAPFREWLMFSVRPTLKTKHPLAGQRNVLHYAL
jgi:hypothetical protein